MSWRYYFSKLHYLYLENSIKDYTVLAGPILESKGMCTIFHKKGKKGKIFENLGKKCANWKIF